MTNTPQPNPADAMLAFWKDAWGRMGMPSSAAGHASGASGAAPFPGASAGSMDPLGWMPTPDMVRRMQSAFMDAMASSAEQYMRSPQFLDSMKQSLDSAVQMRRQMEEMLRKNMGDALRTPGQAGGDVVATLREMEARITARLDELGGRLERLEHADGSGPRPTKAGKT